MAALELIVLLGATIIVAGVLGRRLRVAVPVVLLLLLGPVGRRPGAAPGPPPTRAQPRVSPADVRKPLAPSSNSGTTGPGPTPTRFRPGPSRFVRVAGAP